MHGLSLMFNWLTCADSFTPSNEVCDGFPFYVCMDICIYETETRGIPSWVSC